MLYFDIIGTRYASHCVAKQLRQRNRFHFELSEVALQSK